MDFQHLEPVIRQRLSAKRQEHTQNCVTYIEELAVLFDMNVERARLAALLHDAFRDSSEAELLREAEAHKINISALERARPVLLHGPVASCWAKKELHIRDNDVIEAIRFHTTGAPRVGALTTLLYIVDTLEPGRVYPEADDLRRTVRENNLRDSALAVIEQCLRYQLHKQEPIAEETILWRNRLLYEREQAEIMKGKHEDKKEA